MYIVAARSADALLHREINMRSRRQSIRPPRSKKCPEIGNAVAMHIQSIWELHCEDPESQFQCSIMRTENGSVLSYLDIRSEKQSHLVAMHSALVTRYSVADATARGLHFPLPTGTAPSSRERTF